MIHKSSHIKKGISIAEVSVAVVVVGILFAAIVPMFVRLSAVSKNATRISDIKKIAGYLKTYYSKDAIYPDTLRDLEKGGVGSVPKDPENKIYCTGVPGYSTGDYQYFSCKDCVALGPYKTHPVSNLVQIGALMKRETRRGGRNAGNRWTRYGEGETSDCAANAIRGAGSLFEGIEGNRIGGLDGNVMKIQTNTDQKGYEPWFNIIVASDPIEQPKTK